MESCTFEEAFSTIKETWRTPNHLYRRDGYGVAIWSNQNRSRRVFLEGATGPLNFWWRVNGETKWFSISTEHGSETISPAEAVQIAREVMEENP